MKYTFVLEEHYELKKEDLKKEFINNQEKYRNIRFKNLSYLAKQYLQEPDDHSKKELECEIIDIARHKLNGLKNSEFLSFSSGQEVYTLEHALTPLPEFIYYRDVKHQYSHSMLFPERNEICYYYKHVLKPTRHSLSGKPDAFVPDFGEAFDALIEDIFQKLLETNRLKVLFE